MAADAIRPFDRVNVTSTNGSESFGFLSAGLDQILSVARGHGARDPGAKR